MKISVFVVLADIWVQPVMACDLCSVYGATEAQGGSEFGIGDVSLLGHEHALSLQAVVSGESKGQDTLGGLPIDDTAITAVYLGPQVNFTWSSKLSALVGADLPVSIVTTGQQVVPN